ncbi:MAG: hypothetical protein M1812_003883 [Candelaria pacifica]|nr:MAG: hypothetical protein M1812_003883 [Candelaria pacifica]
MASLFAEGMHLILICPGMHLLLAVLDLYYGQPVVRRLAAANLLPFETTEIWGPGMLPRATTLWSQISGVKHAQRWSPESCPNLHFYCWLMEHIEYMILYNLCLAALGTFSVLMFCILVLTLPGSTTGQWLLSATTLDIVACELLGIALPVGPEELCTWWLVPPSYVLLTYLCITAILDVGRYLFKSKRSKYFYLLLEGRREPLRLVGGTLMEDSQRKRRPKAKLYPGDPPPYLQCLNSASRLETTKKRERKVKKGMERSTDRPNV